LENHCYRAYYELTTLKKTNGVYRFTSATMKVTPSSFTLSGSNHLL